MATPLTKYSFNGWLYKQTLMYPTLCKVCNNWAVKFHVCCNRMGRHHQAERAHHVCTMYNVSQGIDMDNNSTPT